MFDQSDTVGKLAEALNHVQSELSGVARDGTNPHFRKAYATLEAVINTARPALTKHGLSFVQAPGDLSELGLEVTTQVMHKSGEWIRSTLTIPLAKRDPQGAGSAITYACRYSLMAMLGLPPVDDDGEGAMNGAASPPPARPETRARNEPENIISGDEPPEAAHFDKPAWGKAGSSDITEEQQFFLKGMNVALGKCQSRADIAECTANNKRERIRLGINDGGAAWKQLRALINEHTKRIDDEFQAALAAVPSDILAAG